MKNRGSGAAGRAGNAGSVSRALTTNSASSPNNPEALRFRVFLDSPISIGGRKWRMLAGIFLEFSIVAAAIAIPVWFTQRLDTVVPHDPDTGITWVVPKGQPDGPRNGQDSGGDGGQPRNRPRPPDFSNQNEILLASGPPVTPVSADGQTGDPFPLDGPVRWGDANSTGDTFRPGIPGTDGPPRALPPPKYRPTGGNLQPPRQIVRVEPRYPLVAQRARIEGDVILKVLISDRGEIDAVMIVDGHPLLARVAKQAVERWRYEPTLLNGQPIAVSMDVVVRFRIRR